MKIIWLSCTWKCFSPKHFSIKASGRLIDWLVVFNIIFNTQWLYIWWSVLVAEWSEWSTDLRWVTDKLYHIKYGRRWITVTFWRKQIWIVNKNLSNEFRQQIWLGQKSVKWNQIEHALGRKIKFSGFLWSLEDALLILNLSYVTVQHVYALLSYAVSGGFNEGADGRVSTYINILKQ
jgi:hypothetical protein